MDKLLSRQYRRFAIALDCEMGVGSTGDSELIRLTAVDVFTKETLIDNIIKPDVEMAHLSTKYSGVSWKDMNQAIRTGSCFFGKDNARNALLQFVGSNTVVMAHSGRNDFDALRWIHPHIIDTFTLFDDRKKEMEREKQFCEDLDESRRDNITVEEVIKRREERKKAEEEAVRADKMARAAGAAMMGDLTGVAPPTAPTPPPAPKKKKPKGSGALALKTLVKEHAGVDIQMGYGHDSLEDALACRELAVRYLQLLEKESR
jgi:RNA exonuclease 1